MFWFVGVDARDHPAPVAFRSAADYGRPRVALRRFPFCRRAELERDRVVTRWLDDLRDEVTGVLLDGHVVVRSSVCPHFAGEFAVDLRRRVFRCKWHAWEFEIATGRCLSLGFKGCLRRYDTAERDGLIEILYDA